MHIVLFVLLRNLGTSVEMYYSIRIESSPLVLAWYPPPAASFSSFVSTEVAVSLPVRQTGNANSDRGQTQNNNDDNHVGHSVLLPVHTCKRCRAVAANWAWRIDCRSWIGTIASYQKRRLAWIHRSIARPEQMHCSSSTLAACSIGRHIASVSPYDIGRPN